MAWSFSLMFQNVNFSLKLTILMIINRKNRKNFLIPVIRITKNKIKIKFEYKKQYKYDSLNLKY